MASRFFTGTAAWLLCAQLYLALGCKNREVEAGVPVVVASSAEPLAQLGQRPPSLAKMQPGVAVALIPASELTWSFPETSVGPMQVVVSLPARQPEERFPVLIAFHGRGEARKGPARGARGWVDDYGLLRALNELTRPPLEPELFLGFAEPERLQKMNQSLRARPYHGLIVVMPYTPDSLGGDDALARARPLGEFVLQQLLPRVYSETPAIAKPAATGIDGVSLGGRAAWAIGLSQPKRFGVVAGLQAAFDAEEGELLERAALSALKQNPSLTLRLVTSEQDYYLASLSALSARFTRAKVPHRLDVVRGTHSYTFNRGPGVYEMLLFHDRALRAEPPP